MSAFNTDDLTRRGGGLYRRFDCPTPSNAGDLAMPAYLRSVSREGVRLVPAVIDPRVCVEAVNPSLAGKPEINLMDLTSALATGDRDTALTCLHRLQEGGDDPRRLLGMIAWQARDLLKVAARIQAGVPERQIRKDVRMRYDVFQRVAPRMKKGFPHPGELMGRLADANRQMNGHRAGASRVLEELVLELVELTA